MGESLYQSIVIVKEKSIDESIIKTKKDDQYVDVAEKLATDPKYAKLAHAL